MDFSFQDILDCLHMLTGDELQELRYAIDERLDLTLTDPAPPPELVPRNFEE